MAAPVIDYRRHVRRPVGFVIVGLLLFGAAGYLWYDVLKRRSNAEPVPAAYSYTVKQTIDKNVVYFPSSFYTNGPGTNTVYTMELTDKVRTTFHYRFSGSTPQQLAYAYDIRAMVRGRYSPKGDESEMANVWSKDFQLLSPVHGVSTGTGLAVDPSVDVPFAEYRKRIEQLRVALTLPITSDVVVLFTINISGIVDGTPFNDLRTATVTIPLGETIYSIAQKYDKEDTKQVVAASIRKNVDTQAQYEFYAAGALALLALTSLVYGLRKQIFRTPYQRELDKIYRYHDGIIVRASRPTDLVGKRIVAVKSFDDMVNLEEELKLPIVAVPAGSEATQFVIIHGDVVYVYTLGRIVVDKSKSLEEIDATVGKKLTNKHRPRSL